MMAAVDVRRTNRHHVVTARILCNSLKVTHTSKNQRQMFASHQQGVGEFSLRGFKVESRLIGSLAVCSDKLGS